MTTTKKKTASPQNGNFKCSNPSCGKTFAVPIKVENFSSKGEKVYEACPHCLTKVTLKKELEPAAESQTESVQPEKKLEEPPKVLGCTHSFGYLSKRSSKEKIPEECLTCERIVECMLQGVTG
ncbi:MAG: hypothetical protein QXI91_03130 [Candidatus Bathyarchaeia archaeon]